jgi:hypothetical protein
MATGPTNTKRIAELETAVALLEAAVRALQDTPAQVGVGITASNLNDRVEAEIKPLNDRIRAFQAILQGYELVLMERQVTSQEIANAIKRAPKWKELTQAQEAIVGDLLQSV